MSLSVDNELSQDNVRAFVDLIQVVRNKKTLKLKGRA